MAVLGVPGSVLYYAVLNDNQLVVTQVSTKFYQGEEHQTTLPAIKF